MDTIADRIITAGIGEFCNLSGLGRSRVYQLISEGQLDSITLGKRRLVIIDSYRALIDRQRAMPKLPPTGNTKRASAGLRK